MDEMANEILEPYGWEAQDDCVLLSCCGDAVEYDIAQCPTCAAPNPLRALALI